MAQAITDCSPNRPVPLQFARQRDGCVLQMNSILKYWATLKDSLPTLRATGWSEKRFGCGVTGIEGPDASFSAELGD